MLEYTEIHHEDFESLTNKMSITEELKMNWLEKKTLKNCF